jgi:hypothetical protein
VTGEPVVFKFDFLAEGLALLGFIGIMRVISLCPARHVGRAMRLVACFRLPLLFWWLPPPLALPLVDV